MGRNFFLPALSVLLVFALMFGGATRQGFLSDAFTQLLAIPVLAAGIWRLNRSRIDKCSRAALLLFVAIVALPLMQLIPFPPFLWTLFPGRESVRLVFETAEIPLPWLPISLDPDATLRSAISLLPASAVFIAVLTASATQRRFVTLIILGVGVVSVFLGLAQISQGPSSALRFYEVTSPNRMVGFFANPNHAAAFLYSCLPFALAWSARLAGDSSPSGRVAFVGMIVVDLILILGVAMVHSLAGLILSLAAVVGAMAILLPHSGVLPRERKPTVKLLLGLAIVVLVGAVSIPRVMSEIKDNIFNDARPEIAMGTLVAIGNYFPVGSGFGTFVPIYAMDETPATRRSTFINRAHNEWLEWTLEGGILSIGAIGAFLLLYGWMTRKILSSLEITPTFDLVLARMSALIIALILVHSFVDYALRTTAMMAFFAFACAELIASANPKPVRSRGNDYSLSQASSR